MGRCSRRKALPPPSTESAVAEAGRSMHAATGADIDLRSIQSIQVKETI